MPMVGGKEYPYTPAGKAAAKKAAGTMTNPKRTPGMMTNPKRPEKKAAEGQMGKDVKGTLAKKLASLKMAKGK